MKWSSKRDIVLSALFSIFFLLSGLAVNAQTTEFTYQGRLLDSSMPPTGNYDFQFSLWDMLASGTQIGTTQTVAGVSVTGGIFTVKLDFGPTAFADGNTRFLEIEVKPSSGGTYTTLTPRQTLTSAPHSIRSLQSASADSLSAQCVNCVTSAQIESIDGTQITGTLPVTTVPTGSENYIQNAAVPRAGRLAGQPGASFNIGGDGIVGGSLGIGLTPEAGLRLDVGGLGRFLLPNGNIVFGTPNSGTGMTITSPTTRADVRLDGTTLRLASGVAGVGPPGNGIGIDATTVSLPAFVNLAATASGNNIAFGSPNSGTGMTISGPSARADLRLDTTTLRLTAGPGGVGPPGNGIAINTAGNVGIGTIDPITALHVVGTTRSSIVEITGGSDLAEKFEFSEEVKPGMVVAIDAKNAGKLQLARGAYNRRVAGIISGANNLSAGMTLPDVKNGANGMPVALSGRVWVYADATKHAIAPGDMLTTAGTLPGYAKKVTSHKRAQGAIIGKAMTELKSGSGLVLVLVTLQ